MTPRGGMGMNTAVAEAHDSAGSWPGSATAGPAPASWAATRPSGAPSGPAAPPAQPRRAPSRAAPRPSPRTSTAASPTPGSPRPTAIPARPSTSSAPGSPS
jgi:hypothetical protein